MKRTVLGIVLSLALAPGLAAHDSGRVERIVPGGAAEAAGLRVGDRIQRLGELPLVTYDDLQRIVAAHRPGDTVPVVVAREGELVTLTLTFGARPNGDPSIGFGIALEPDPGREDSSSGTSRCFAWIEETYRVEGMLAELGLDRADDLATILDCVERDTTRMGNERAVRYCKNVFQVHCSAGDLLAEIGEAKISRCAEALAPRFGADLERSKVWRTCVEPRLFDGYVRDGSALDLEACRAALLDDCTTGLDAAYAAGTLTESQAAFVACCAGDADPARCSMLGSRAGACDAPEDVCFDRDAAEWIRCSAID